jgi:hypothetical protein
MSDGAVELMWQARCEIEHPGYAAGAKLCWEGRPILDKSPEELIAIIGRLNAHIEVLQPGTGLQTC